MDAGSSVVRERLRVTGTVQGVGFRPFIYRQAVALGLAGFVRNDTAGVVIEAEGPGDALEELTRRITSEAPPLARVETVRRETLPLRGAGGFTIDTTQSQGPISVMVTADASTCEDCRREILDPADRRFGYAFTNCTNCGPRYTIVESVPYDRANTTMAGFVMCERCQAEYDDPADRRFHAQPNACATCGPRLRWHTTPTPAPTPTAIPTATQGIEGHDALAAAAAALEAGAIVAVKGLGGYHLAADATNQAAVSELRRRKARDHKPFAVMCADLEMAATCVEISPDAATALAAAARPILLLPRRTASPVAEQVAPGLDEVGVLLAYTPLHHLLLAATGRPLVMTSGNLSDEPIAHHDLDALDRLAPLVDGFLTHNRPIHIRCDDSVARMDRGRLRLLRRSRGFAPAPLALPVTANATVLAVGAELKSTIAVARGASVVASHHLGDLEHLATYTAFQQAVVHLPALCGVAPEVVAHDLHPEYLSTKFALECGLRPVAVQHHHAHIASCLVEHTHTGPVLGIAFDGLGYGADGTLWGGEFLVADLQGARRAGHLRPTRLPGGSTAIREPWRMAVSWATTLGWDGPVFDEAVASREAVRVVAALAGSEMAPVTTSMGRLFDAVAALLGVRTRASYEAQAAIELEALARGAGGAVAHPAVALAVDRSGPLPVLDPAGLLGALVTLHRAGTDVGVLAAAFHHAVGTGAAALAEEIAREEGLGTVVLTGGVFQNRTLQRVARDALERAGLEVLTHGAVPANDGGISIGQAAIAAAWTSDVDGNASG